MSLLPKQSIYLGTHNHSFLLTKHKLFHKGIGRNGPTFFMYNSTSSYDLRDQSRIWVENSRSDKNGPDPNLNQQHWVWSYIVYYLSPHCCWLFQYEAGLTLSSLSCFLSPDLARDLANDIMSLLTSTKPYLRSVEMSRWWKYGTSSRREVLRPIWWGGDKGRCEISSKHSEFH